MKRFDEKSVLITGAAGDIGFSVAKRLYEEGAHVYLTDIDEKKLQSKLNKLDSNRQRSQIFTADVTNVNSIKHIVKAIEQNGQQIDYLFNNAGYQGDFKKVFEYPEDDFRRVLDINVTGVFNVMKIVAQHMIQNGKGSIVNTASMAGVGGPPNMIAYGASKFAVVGMTQSAAKDLAPYNIRVNAISPAFMGPGYMWERQVNLQAEANSQYFDSNPEKVAEQMIDMVPMRRYGDITEIQGTVCFLLSDDASYITGINVPIAGGIL